MRFYLFFTLRHIRGWKRSGADRLVVFAPGRCHRTVQRPTPRTDRGAQGEPGDRSRSGARERPQAAPADAGPQLRHEATGRRLAANGTDRWTPHRRTSPFGSGDRGAGAVARGSSGYGQTSDPRLDEAAQPSSYRRSWPGHGGRPGPERPAPRRHPPCRVDAHGARTWVLLDAAMVDTAAQANDAAHDNPSHDQGHQQDHNQNNGLGPPHGRCPGGGPERRQAGQRPRPRQRDGTRSLSSIPT